MKWTRYENRLLFLLRIHLRIDFLFWNLNFDINIVDCAKQTKARKLDEFHVRWIFLLLLLYSSHIRFQFQYTFIWADFFSHFGFNLNYFDMEVSFTIRAIANASSEVHHWKNGKQSNQIKNIININPYVDSMWSVHKPFMRSWHTHTHALHELYRCDCFSARHISIFREI